MAEQVHFGFHAALSQFTVIAGELKETGHVYRGTGSIVCIYAGKRKGV